jgi:hypothetical protein
MQGRISGNVLPLSLDEDAMSVGEGNEAPKLGGVLLGGQERSVVVDNVKA